MYSEFLLWSFSHYSLFEVSLVGKYNIFCHCKEVPFFDNSEDVVVVDVGEVKILYIHICRWMHIVFV